MADKKISALTGASTPLAGTEVLPIVQSGETKQVSITNLTAGRNVTSNRLAASGDYVANGGDLTLTNTNGGHSWRIGDGIAGAVGQLVIFDATAGAIRAVFDSSGNQKINNGNLIQGTAAKGINFTANTPVAGMTSQLLNWYEEGTWTPTVTFGGGNAGMTIAPTAKYTRIGRQVTFTCQIVFTDKGSSTGNANINNLPFTSQSGVSQAFLLQGDNLTFVGAYLIGYLGGASTSLGLYTIASGTTTAMTDTSFANNTLLRISGTYFV